MSAVTLTVPEDGTAPEGAQPARRYSIAYLMVNYAPAWEGVSKMVLRLKRELADEADTRVVGFNTRGELLRLDSSGTRQLPAPVLLAGARVVRAAIGPSDVVHLFASAGERHLLPKVAGSRAVLSIAKATHLQRLERNAPYLHRFRFLIVESRFQRELLEQAGVPEERIQLIYPSAPIHPYVAPPAGAPFTIVFASSPLGPAQLIERGVHLLLQAATRLPDVHFVFVWRVRDELTLRRLILRAGIGNAEVRSGKVNMREMYDTAHATILPALTHDGLKPCPLSLVESLAHGKPVLVSRPTMVSDEVEASGAGIVFEPRVEALCDAIIELRNRYATYQARCHPTAATTFDPHVFVARHRELYARMERERG